MQNFMKICLVAAELFCVDRWIDRQTGIYDKANENAFIRMNETRSVTKIFEGKLEVRIGRG